MNKVFGMFLLVVMNLISAPAFAQSYEADAPVNPWQDSVSAPTGVGAYALPSTHASTRFSGAGARTAGISDQSVNQNALPSGEFKLGFGAPGAQTGKYGSALPPVATSSVSLSICDAPPKDPPYCGGSCGGNGGGDTSNLPPPPGEGYQPIFQHGVFVGYMSPELISQLQTDPRGAWAAFAQSSDFVGPEGLRLSLLAETGAATPEQMAALYQMALFGM